MILFSKPCIFYSTPEATSHHYFKLYKRGEIIPPEEEKEEFIKEEEFKV